MAAKRKKKVAKVKVCADCGRRKPAHKFGRNPRMKTGLKSYCNDCINYQQRERREDKRKTSRAKRSELLK